MMNKLLKTIGACLFLASIVMESLKHMPVHYKNSDTYYLKIK